MVIKYLPTKQFAAGWKPLCLILFLLLNISVTPPLLAEQQHYQPDKVVYDVSSANVAELNNILDRVNLLQIFYGNDPFESSIIIVLHEGVIPLFANTGNKSNPNLIRRAQNLTMGDVIQFRLCKASAKQQGFKQTNFKKFIRLIPMADAEIIKLQHKGYAYLR